jgi:hypothetical protein
LGCWCRFQALAGGQGVSATPGDRAVDVFGLHQPEIQPNSILAQYTEVLFAM